MFIVRQVLSREGLLNEFTFIPESPLLKECADFVTIHCKLSDHIDVPSGRMDVTVELGAPGFRRFVGKPSFMLRVLSSPSGTRLEYPIEMEDEDFRKILGLHASEWDEFSRELVRDICEACLKADLASKNFRIRILRVRGEPKKIRFRPKSMIADYLTEVGIDLDLSGFIDLENRPQKKGRDNEPIETYLERLRAELRSLGWSEEDIEKEIEKQSVIAQYDIMLSLYYGSRGDSFALGMYTLANGDVRFFNGSADNLYEQDFIRILKIPPKEIRAFKENLQREVLDVLHEVGIKYMSNAVHDLGLDEPWADSVREINMEAIERLRKQGKNASKKKKKKKVVV